METREFGNIELNALDEDQGIFEGHAAIFDKPDDDFGDVILPGSFKKSLHKHPKKRVKMLHEHERKALLGVWEEIKEDSTGLFVRGKLLMQVQAAQEAFIFMKEGILDSLSIGFRATEETFDRKTGRRTISELMLFEISLVSIPAQLSALVTSVKHMSPEEITSKRDLEKALRDAGFSESTSKFICAGWTPPAQRDVEGGTELVANIRSLIQRVQTATGAK